MSGEDVTGAVSRRAVRASACRRRSGVEPLFSLMPAILSRCVCLHTLFFLDLLSPTASLRFGLREPAAVGLGLSVLNE